MNQVGAVAPCGQEAENVESRLSFKPIIKSAACDHDGIACFDGILGRNHRTLLRGNQLKELSKIGNPLGKAGIPREDRFSNAGLRCGL